MFWRTWSQSCRINHNMQKLYVFIFFLCSLTIALQAQTREDVLPENARMEFSKTIHIYPNPAIDFVNVKFDTRPAANLKVTVHNIIGNSIPVEMEIVDQYELRIRVKELDSGYYLLAVKDDENNFQGTYKFLKR